jgi:methylated-DNA-[protein]-cysteine S-methyltransferase
MSLSHIVMSSPIGPLTLVADNNALVAVLFKEDRLTSRYLANSMIAPTHLILQAARDQLHEYFKGKRQEFDIPINLDGTIFQQRAWQALRCIPYGQTCSYGAQAAHMGTPKAARAVGAANGCNPIPVIVPCHRVTGASGTLTGYAGGLDTKAFLLEHEKKYS